MFPGAALTDSEIAAAVAAFRRAAAMYLNQEAFARVLGTSQQNVSKLLRNRRMCPRRHVEVVEGATGVPKEDLRPDIYPRETATVPQGFAGDGAGGRPSTDPRAEPAPDPMTGFAA